jgi:hypothetical protein
MQNLPTPQEVRMLRRIGQGYVKLTFTAEGKQYTYDDGTPLPLNKSPEDPDGTMQFNKLLATGWLIPDKQDTLLENVPPQIYRTRKQ